MNHAVPLTLLPEAHPRPTPDVDRIALLKNPVFGRAFTDHMVTIRYSDARGWHDGKIGERKPFHSTRRPMCCTTPRRSSRA